MKTIKGKSLPFLLLWSLPYLLHAQVPTASPICTSSANTLLSITVQREADTIDSYLQVADDRRHLVDTRTNEPFVLISQTMWAASRQMTREQIIGALDKTKELGFTAIQLIAHSHYMGTNQYGDGPFDGEDFSCPAITEGDDPKDATAYDWWDHLEFIVEECAQRDLLVLLLPTWREQWDEHPHLNTTNAMAYGQFLGARYRHLNRHIAWILGGDAAAETTEEQALHRTLAEGIATGINGVATCDNLMMSYHSYGPSTTTSFYAEDEPFMDFNSIQSGHGLDRLEGLMEQSWSSQVKPTLDLEPYYDKNGEEVDITRTMTLWGLFSGGFGTAYGSWNTWHCGARDDLAVFEVPASYEEGYGGQIRHLHQLLTAHFLEKRRPNQAALHNNWTKGHDRVLAVTATDSSFLYAYTPTGTPFAVDLSHLSSGQHRYQWLNPRTGQVTYKTPLPAHTPVMTFSAPSNGSPFSGNDWILTIAE